MTTKTRREGFGGDGCHLSSDLTWRRVASPARCPVRSCGHDNRDREHKCSHFLARIEKHQDIDPPAAGQHVIAQGYQDTPSLRERFWVYKEN